MPYKLDPSYNIYEYACHEGNYMMTDALELLGNWISREAIQRSTGSVDRQPRNSKRKGTSNVLLCLCIYCFIRLRT